MARLIVILLLAGAGYYLYSNWDGITSGFINSAKQDKTVQVVGETRSELNADVEATEE